MCVYVRETSENPLSCCDLYPHAKKIASALRHPQAILEDPSEVV